MWQGTRTVPLPPSYAHVPRSYFVRFIVYYYFSSRTLSNNTDYRSSSIPSNNWCRVQFVIRTSTFENTPSISVFRTFVFARAFAPRPLRFDRWNRRPPKIRAPAPVRVARSRRRASKSSATQQSSHARRSTRDLRAPPSLRKWTARWRSYQTRPPARAPHDRSRHRAHRPAEPTVHRCVRRRGNLGRSTETGNDLRRRSSSGDTTPVEGRTGAVERLYRRGFPNGAKRRTPRTRRTKPRSSPRLGLIGVESLRARRARLAAETRRSAVGRYRTRRRVACTSTSPRAADDRSTDADFDAFELFRARPRPPTDPARRLSIKCILVPFPPAPAHRRDDSSRSAPRTSDRTATHRSIRKLAHRREPRVGLRGPRNPAESRLAPPIHRVVRR